MNKYTVLNTLTKSIVFSEDIEKMIANDVNLNTLRHEATNYDKVWRKAYTFDTDANWVIRTLKNNVNSSLFVKVQDHKNAQIAELKTIISSKESNVIPFPVKVKTAADWTVEYQETGVSFENAKKLAESKVANAQLRAKGAAAKAARKARRLEAV